MFLNKYCLNKHTLLRSLSISLNSSKNIFNPSKVYYNFCENNKPDIKKELPESEEDKVKRLQLEEKLRLINEKYTEEELVQINEKCEEIEFMRIKEEYRKKLHRAKKLSLFLNIPLAVLIVWAVDKYFEERKEKGFKAKTASFFLTVFGYNLFLVAFLVLYGYRNIVVSARYIPKEKSIIFTKLSMLNKPFTVKENLDSLKRMRPGMLTPHISLKNAKYNNIYSMNGIADWQDRKLFNVLFPNLPRKEKIRKKIKLF
jgi:hypothetical protein